MAAAMNLPVPVTRSVEAVYPPDQRDYQEQRFDHLIKRFSDTYDGEKPAFVARSPGRVNLIGEHIDYSLYGVLPMAIIPDVLIAVSTPPKKTKGGATVTIANTNSHKFPQDRFLLTDNHDVPIDPANHTWTNYFKAGINGAAGLLRKKRSQVSFTNMKVLVGGNVPECSGLSSSAAFVCASALAVLRANGESQVIKKDLVELAIASERAVGVNSGGMDQSASVFSVKDEAVSVSFSPSLHAETLPFPKLNPPITFMIAQSFVVSEKQKTGPERYNLRVVECTLAAEVLAKHLQLTLPTDSSPLGRSLRGVQNVFFKDPDHSEAPPKKQLELMLVLVKQHLSRTPYTRLDLSKILGLSIPELEERYMTTTPVRAAEFSLLKRAQHVFTEAIRVLDFKRLLQSPPADSLLQSLGELMNETQASCEYLYECSCPEIDSLCAIAREAGAYGSRLTGAGWGGCTVHLVPKHRVEGVRKAFVEKYYLKREPDMSNEKLAAAIVVSQPGNGSMVYVPTTLSVGIRLTRTRRIDMS